MADFEQAKKELQSIFNFKSELKILENKIKDCESILKAQSYSDEPRGGQPKAIDDKYVDVIEKKEKLQAQSQAMSDQYIINCAALENIENSQWRILLGLKYVSRLSRQEIMDEMAIGKRTYFNMLKWGTEEFSKFI